MYKLFCDCISCIILLFSMNIQGSLLNQSFDKDAEVKLMTVLRCLEDLIMSIEK